MAKQQGSYRTFPQDETVAMKRMMREFEIPITSRNENDAYFHSAQLAYTLQSIAVFMS